MRILITGARGFVGPYVARALRHVCGDNIVLLPTAKEAGEHPAFGAVEMLDVTDPEAVTAAVIRYRPTHIIHLAGIAAPAVAHADPQSAWKVHLQGALNLGHALLKEDPHCWLLHIGSGLVYGETAKAGVPLREDMLLAPVDEYSVTKAVADLALGALVRQGLRCIRFRPFNHTGPGQTAAFAIPAFAMQIAQIEFGLQPPTIQVGNLDAERDFLDVRDVAHSYALAVRTSETLESGAIFNISSGIPRRINEILKYLLSQSHVEINIEREQERLRPNEIPRIVGDSCRARACLCWEPEHDFEDTLAAVLHDWRVRIAHMRSTSTTLQPSTVSRG